MAVLLRLTVLLVALGHLPTGLLQYNNSQAGNRHFLGGLSFAIPGLSINLAAGNAGLGENGLLGRITVTRTLVTTVATVTIPSFQTCTTIMPGMMPCHLGYGRRKRNAEDLENIEATPTIQLIIGSTTISNPVAVTEYLEAHKPSTQSVIFPDMLSVKVNLREGGEATELYPSHDTPDTAESVIADDGAADSAVLTTETPTLQGKYLNGGFFKSTQSKRLKLVKRDLNKLDEEKGRNEIAKRLAMIMITTQTEVIRVTSVATSSATGPMATLTVQYQGCSPQVLPVSALPCAV